MATTKNSCHFCDCKTLEKICPNCNKMLPTCGSNEDAHKNCMDCGKDLCKSCVADLGKIKCSNRTCCSGAATFFLCSYCIQYYEKYEICEEIIAECYGCMHKGVKYNYPELKEKHFRDFHRL